MSRYILSYSQVRKEEKSLFSVRLDSKNFETHPTTNKITSEKNYTGNRLKKVNQAKFEIIIALPSRMWSIVFLTRKEVDPIVTVRGFR